MDSNHAFRRLREDLEPSKHAQNELKGRVMARIQEKAVWMDLRSSLTPEKHVQTSVLNRIIDRIAAPKAHDAFDRLRDALQPRPDVRQTLWSYVSARLVPQAATVISYRAPKWIAAAVIVAIGLRASPILFLAPTTIAESSVIVLPTSGDVNIALHQLWQPVKDETEIREPVQIRTYEGEATVILHDDGNIRLAPNTTIVLNDVSDRPDVSPTGSTITLVSGSVWLQGLLPNTVEGISLGTEYGIVSVHGGSVSVTAGESVSVKVWNRSASVTQKDVALNLVAGESTELSREVPTVQQIPQAAYDDAWTSKNLRKDAVHQREVAQMQQERRSERAGILPNSPLYGVKRIAETMDVLLTLDPNEKAQKKLQQATTRLSEAAALIAQGQTGSTLPLQEYKQTLLDVASGSGDTAVKTLVQKEVAENVAEISAVLPNDNLYAVKKAVLETTAELPDANIDQKDVNATVLVDTLDMLHDVVETGGDTQNAKDALAAIAPQLDTLTTADESSLKPEAKKEALSLLSDIADTLNAKDANDAPADPEIVSNVKPFLPQPKPAKPEVKHLTEDEIATMVAGMRERIFLYKQPRSRYSQLIHEMQQIRGNPDEGTILRALYHALPVNGLATYVRTAIQELREEQKEVDDSVHPAAGPGTGSGDTIE